MIILLALSMLFLNHALRLSATEYAMGRPANQMLNEAKFSQLVGFGFLFAAVLAGYHS